MPDPQAIGKIVDRGVEIGMRYLDFRPPDPLYFRRLVAARVLHRFRRWYRPA